MSDRKPEPGVSREQRIDEQGLERLRRQLASGVRIARPVLLQWIRRYGDDARAVLQEHGVDIEE